MSAETQPASELSADAQLTLEWLRQHYYGGRAPIYSILEIARGLFARTEGPAPGSTFDPSTWGRVRQALYDLEQRGLLQQARLPQGDHGFQLVTSATDE